MKQLWAVAVLIASGLAATGEFTVTGAQSASVPSDLPLLGSSDVQYLGMFRVPDTDGAGSDLSYGSILGLGANGTSLIWADHAWYSGVCEVSIPSLGGRAQILQRCANVDEGMVTRIGPGLNDVNVTGALAWNGRLIWSATSFYDANGVARFSHFTSGPVFATRGDVQGPFRVGTAPPAAAGGYFGVIPDEWRAAFGGPALTGNCCLSIAWRTSSGPGVTVFDPDALQGSGQVPGTTLLHYPINRELAPGTQQNPTYNQTTAMATVAFPAGSRTVLFVGRHGLGPYCYGTGSVCPDAAAGHQGGHAYPYVHQVWAYDALDLLRVRTGELNPWEVRPYGVWILPEMNSSGNATVAGGTFDIRTGRLYLAQHTGGGDQIVHVYRVGAGAGGRVELTAAAAPQAPSGLSADVRSTQVTLRWAPPAGGALPSAYEVIAGSTPGGSDLTSVQTSTTSFSTDAAPGTYFVRVVAITSGGVSLPSNEVRVVVASPQAQSCRAPEDGFPLTARVQQGEVSVHWRAARFAAEAFTLHVGSTSGASDIARVDLGQTNSLTYDVPSGNYYVRIRATSPCGEATSREARIFVK